MALEPRRYTRDEVISGGFEARCELLSGARYLWHGAEGIRIDARGVLQWLGDPADLPDGDWYATDWGEMEIAEAGLDS